MFGMMTWPQLVMHSPLDHILIQRGPSEASQKKTTFVCHMHSQTALRFKDSRAIVTFEWLLSISNTLCHMTSRTIVWDRLSTVFAANFSVRIHVSLELPPTFARFVTFLTYYHTIIMLVLHVLLEMFFRKSFIATHDTSKHGDCRFVLLAMMLCVSKR